MAYQDRTGKRLIRPAGARQDIIDTLFGTHAMDRVGVCCDLEWLWAKLSEGDRSQTVELSIRGAACSPEQAGR